jgi:hypothetical protein
VKFSPVHVGVKIAPMHFQVMLPAASYVNVAALA